MSVRTRETGSETMHTRARIFWLLMVMLFSFQAGVPSAGERDTPRGEDFSGVDFKNGLLKVSVENHKFQEVMDEVAQRAGIQVVINDPADEDLTIDFGYLPLEKGLKRLLRGKSYVFVHRPGEGVDPIQSSRLMKVWVLPKSWGARMAGLGEMAENRSADHTRQTEALKKKMLSQDQERLREVLQGFSQDGTDLENQFYDALEKIQEMDIFGEIRKIEDGVFQGSLQGEADAMGKIHGALEGIQHMEKVIMDSAK